MNELCTTPEFLWPLHRKHGRMCVRACVALGTGTEGGEMAWRLEVLVHDLSMCASRPQSDTRSHHVQMNLSAMMRIRITLAAKFMPCRASFVARYGQRSGISRPAPDSTKTFLFPLCTLTYRLTRDA